MRRLVLIGQWIVALGLAAALFSPAGAITSRYVEDFTTTAYRDTVNTTALWSAATGELKLPPYEFGLAGSCDTPGNAQDAVVDGNYLYVADYDAGLQVIDISDPTNPTLVGGCDTEGYAFGLAISGKYAYVADAYYLAVIDVTNPAAPSLVASYETPGSPWSVAISGDYAYIAEYVYGLEVVSIANPASPTFVASYSTPGYATGVVVSGDYAYVSTYDYGLEVVNITNPASPTFAGRYNSYGTALDVAVDGDYAYLADGWYGLQVFSISSPTNPVSVGYYDTPTAACRVVVSGNCAYVADTGGLQIVDVSDPASPVSLGHRYTTGGADGVAVSANYAYVTENNSGVEVMEVSAPANLTVAGTCDTPGSAYNVAISGAYAFVADGSAYLRTVNISNPASPSLAGNCWVAGDARDVAVSGDYAYVAASSAGLRVVNIANPASPTQVAYCYPPGAPYGVAVAGDYAFVASYGGGLQIVNIANPASPTVVGYCDTPGNAMDVVVDGDYAYVADYVCLTVVNITNPAAPVLAGFCSLGGTAYGVAHSGSYAYVADYGYGLQVVNVSNPASPMAIGYYYTGNYAMGVAVDGDRAYVATYGGGLKVLDISNPPSPTYIGACPVPNFTYGVALWGDYAFVAGYGQGVAAVEVFQRRYDVESNVGRSLAVDDSDSAVLAARLASAHSDSVRWEMSADGGANWMTAAPDNAWCAFSATGSNLIWRSSHYYVGGGVNPACTDLAIEWLYGFPVIDGIADVGNDQGRQVRLTWVRSGYDAAGSATPITEYAIFRRIDQVMVSSSPAAGPTAAPELAAGEQGVAAYPPGDWDFVKVIPAYGEDSYSTVVATLADSTSEGMYSTAFFIRAATATPTVFYDSPVDSGYSVDNLAPAPPGGLVMASATSLAWEESEAADFDYFTVYGSETPILDGTAALIGYTSGTTMGVEGDLYAYYHVTATDFAGNEGDAATAENAYAGVGAGESQPQAFALRQITPNPFAGRTSVAFDVPVASRTSLRVFDAQGRQVRTLADGIYPAGRHSVSWAGDDDGGRPLGSGIYLIRIEAGGFEAARKVLLTR